MLVLSFYLLPFFRDSLFIEPNFNICFFSHHVPHINAQTTILPYVEKKEIKKDLDEAFQKKYELKEFTLSKIRSKKKKAMKLAVKMALFSSSFCSLVCTLYLCVLSIVQCQQKDELFTESDHITLTPFYLNFLTDV